MYIVVLCPCSTAQMEICKDVLSHVAAPLVQWAYNESITIPAFVHSEYQNTLATRHTFWRTIEDHVTKKGCFPPVMLFKHAIQSFYLKTKAGVDGTTQTRAMLRSSSSHFKWEQKLVSHVI